MRITIFVFLVVPIIFSLGCAPIFARDWNEEREALDAQARLLAVCMIESLTPGAKNELARWAVTVEFSRAITTSDSEVIVAAMRHCGMTRVSDSPRHGTDLERFTRRRFIDLCNRDYEYQTFESLHRRPYLIRHQEEEAKRQDAVQQAVKRDAWMFKDRPR